ncbi:DUF4349 domain-containing protein [Streptomyces sp. NBC_00873]|uniref:DUF4349 domain-containing protein n=1 Tax=unclassified Streptomyces TaxID=2593676 RepID=UPI003863F923|nr:DUF4349 domain-containing protein [Streptomyces sp. NBC_00873]WTA46956.1 DUF4349 domain-containing protein [Streptomyces sp. NBC_00842]
MQRARHSSRSSTRRSRTALAAGMLAALLALSGCGGADDSSGSSKTAADSADHKAAAPAERADSAGGKSDRGAADGSPARSTRSPALTTTHVIRKASLSVEVKSVPKAAAAARSVTEDAGGLVANESTDRIDDLREMSHLVLRVPQAEYDAVLRKLAGGGKLLSRTSEAKDVTDQVVDVESRIATQRASVARVRKLMDRAEKIADVVALEGELSNRQAELESLLTRQESLKDRTTLATITLDLSEPESAAQGADDDDPGFVDALGGGWHAFVTTVKWIAMAVGAAAPFLAAAAALLLLWRLVRTRLTRHRTPRTAEHAPVPAAAPEHAPVPPETPSAP